MKYIYKIKQLLSNFVLLFCSFTSKRQKRVQLDIPYVSQFANPSWAEMVLKNNQPLNRDAMWQESGAQSIEEYERWALTTCGMACTAMALAFYNKGSFKTIELARDAAQAGAYKTEANEISGLHYQPFTSWITRYDLRATIYTKLTFQSMQVLLSSGSVVIASVNPNIRGFNTAPITQVGGHLILITGYDQENKIITFHNPSGFENNHSQKNHSLPWKEFLIYFAGRGIAITSR